MGKILVVDDDPEIRTLVSITLGQNHSVLEAGDGLEAVDRARKEQPELILLDVMMPHMDGFEACRNLKGDPKTHKIPVIMLTARGTKEDIDKGKTVGCEEYFIKPFSPIALLDKVYQVLEKSRAEAARADA